MVNKGDMINDRYQIIRSIGEGGMANVYLAEDTILNRRVAVKILRGDLASDEKFVRRFQREAISASSLNDPNIVEVYDVGEDDGKYFIVMEYVEGKTLKQLIKKRGSLTLPEVIDIMLQLTKAIAHAHESYIIHRDIKPQNVIILEDGTVKIMDFGIAVALNSGDLTQTNSVMGTVYYIPPEQANGGAATIKSDIYSLGILMYELVTGHVPFKGDNPVEVALKHMKEPLPSICEYDPDMPQSIENIILRASAKNPKNRYESAMEMHDDLKTALDPERFNEPKIKYDYPETGFDNEDLPKNKESRSARREDQNEKKKDKKMNKALIIIGSIIAVLIIALVTVFLIVPRIMNNQEAEIPDVSGMTVNKAESTLEKEGFTVAEKTKKENSDDVKKNRVIDTEPGIGRTVKKSTEITLIVSKGTDKIEIEDYKGKNYYDIKAKLEAKGIEVITEERDVPSTDSVKEGTILDQDVEPGEKLGKGDTITLIIPNVYTSYPNFVEGGYSETSVRQFCEENGITLNVSYVTDPSSENGTILYQNMSPGSKVTEGATLNIKVVKNESQSTENNQNTDTQNTQTDGDQNQ